MNPAARREEVAVAAAEVCEEFRIAGEAEILADHLDAEHFAVTERGPR